MKQFSLKHLSIPIFLELLLRYLSIIINTAMVSQHSNFLVGAMGAGNQILDLFITVFTFLSIGCSVVITQAIGAHNSELANKALHQSLFLNTMLGFICGAIILLGSEFLLHILRVPDELLYDSGIYLRMLGICLFFDAIGIIFAAILRIYNLAYWSMFITAIMDIVILFCNYIVLNFTNLELFGVGMSSIIGRVIATIFLLIIIIYKLKIKISFKYMINLEKDVLKKILSIGGFSAGENLLWIIQYTIAFAFIAMLGKENLSVQTIYFQLSLFMMLIGQSISVANEIIIGKLVGAKKINIAYKHTWAALYFSIIASFVVALMNYVLQGYTMDILGLLKELKTIMIPLFTLSIFLEVARTLNIVMVNSLRASGDAKFPFYMALLFMFCVSLPLGYVLCFYFEFGLLGIWIGFLCDELLRGLANTYRWKSRKWTNKAIV